MNREEIYRQFGPMFLEAMVLMQRERDKVIITKINEIADALGIKPISEITEENMIKILDKRNKRLTKYDWMNVKL